jgi:DNA-binding LacI/PurR family transcriptional regulator
MTRNTKDIKWVAAKAGVSVATISRAMNPATRSKVAKATLQKVDAVVRRYGYAPNVAAKYLRQSTTHTVGVLLPFGVGIFRDDYYTEILAGITDYLAGTDFQFKLLLLKNTEQQWNRYDFKSSERIDGLVVTHWSAFFASRAVLEKVNVPCVVINDADASIKTQFVCGDHLAGGALAAQYLYACGHRRIAVLTGPEHSVDSNLRVAGFQQYLQQKGAPLQEGAVVRADFQEQKAYEVTAKLFATRLSPTAVFCCNDQMALGVLRRLRELGLACPDHVSVLGYDDISQAAAAQPPLSTMHVPLYELGTEAVRILVGHLSSSLPEKKLTGCRLLPVSLVERASVKTVG